MANESSEEIFGKSGTGRRKSFCRKVKDLRRTFRQNHWRPRKLHFTVRLKCSEIFRRREYMNNRFLFIYYICFLTSVAFHVSCTICVSLFFVVIYDKICHPKKYDKTTKLSDGEWRQIRWYDKIQTVDDNFHCMLQKYHNLANLFLFSLPFIVYS